jgi:hypothetical protein
VVFTVSGSEAIDVAIKIARGSTGRRRIVSTEGSYHGATGLAVAAGGDAPTRQRYLLDLPEFVHVPWDDLDAMRAAVDDDTAAVLLEAIPATLGFPPPSPGYLRGVQELCRERGALFVVDEVQTGLGRTGSFWFSPAGGAPPRRADRRQGPLRRDLPGVGHAARPRPLRLVHRGVRVAPEQLRRFRARLRRRQHRVRPRRRGRVPRARAGARAALRTRLPRRPVRAPAARAGDGARDGTEGGAFEAWAELFRAGVFAFPAAYDTSVLQFKPPLILRDEEADEIVSLVRAALGMQVASDPRSPVPVPAVPREERVGRWRSRPTRWTSSASTGRPRRDPVGGRGVPAGGRLRGDLLAVAWPPTQPTVVAKSLPPFDDPTRYGRTSTSSTSTWRRSRRARSCPCRPRSGPCPRGAAAARTCCSRACRPTPWAPSCSPRGPGGGHRPAATHRGRRAAGLRRRGRHRRAGVELGGRRRRAALPRRLDADAPGRRPGPARHGPVRGDGAVGDPLGGAPLRGPRAALALPRPAPGRPRHRRQPRARAAHRLDPGAARGRQPPPRPPADGRGGPAVLPGQRPHVERHPGPAAGRPGVAG